ncbi:MAG: TlpA disulfide reductase family protein [Planctomycetota bacterium]
MLRISHSLEPVTRMVIRLPRRFTPPLATALVMAAMLVTSGCTRGPADSAVGESAELPEVPGEPETDIASDVPSQPDSDTLTSAEQTNAEASGQDLLTATENGSTTETSPLPIATDPTLPRLPEVIGPGPGVPVLNDATAERQIKPIPQLKADLPADQLIAFLAEADEFMQAIVAGQTQYQTDEDAIVGFQQIIGAKLEASRRLIDMQAATDVQQTEGRRGELQSLSHLASLGDLKAAEALEELAEGYRDHSDPRLQSDSRLVLIGFAIESLRNGQADAAQQISSLVQGVRDASQLQSLSSDVPTLMVMSDAREALLTYGHEDAAAQVRQIIIEIFGKSSDPMIADMAARLAGSVQYDGIDRLLDQALREKAVLSPDEWTQAMQTLIDEAPDLRTVQYLAGAAIELESRGDRVPDLLALANETYRVLEQRFASDGSSAMGQEAAMAVESRRARTSILDQPFPFDLLTVDGKAQAMQAFRGRVVLMPFWSTDIPLSVKGVTLARDVVDSFPGQAAVMAMNLDLEDVPVANLMANANLDFDSLRATASDGSVTPMQVARQFGVVAYPFIAVIDPDGNVAAINISGLGLEETVKRLAR